VRFFIPPPHAQQPPIAPSGTGTPACAPSPSRGLKGWQTSPHRYLFVVRILIETPRLEFPLSSLIAPASKFLIETKRGFCVPRGGTHSSPSKRIVPYAPSAILNPPPKLTGKAIRRGKVIHPVARMAILLVARRQGTTSPPRFQHGFRIVK
jgi:hypothetical protein